jgi:acyl dehydratase
VTAAATPPLKVFAGLDDLIAASGTKLGYSHWLTVDQERINTFADATGDHQWIHVDPDQAATGPFGSTIAHGYLTLSLLPALAAQVYRVDNAKMSVNYGLNKVRFVTPVRVGAAVRDAVELVSVDPLDAGAQLTFRHTIEIDGTTKPACVVESISRQYF